MEARLAEYVATLRFEEIDETARAAFGRMLLDTVGVAVAGFREPTCRPVATAFCAWDREGTASVVGSERRGLPAAAGLWVGGVGAWWGRGESPR
ncbi:MAG: MmgE/PrpD family protein, partial [Rhodospirillaceae bacterium]|nr:MmgE/PrpD family protein [Rhodospirillaceae bacterium]